MFILDPEYHTCWESELPSAVTSCSCLVYVTVNIRGQTSTWQSLLWVEEQEPRLPAGFRVIQICVTLWGGKSETEKTWAAVTTATVARDWFHWTPEGALTTQLFVLEGKLNLPTALTSSTSVWATTRTVITTFCPSKHKLSSIYINGCRNTVNSGWPSRRLRPSKHAAVRERLRWVTDSDKNGFKLIQVKHVSTPNTPELPEVGRTCWLWNRRVARFPVSCLGSERILKHHVGWDVSICFLVFRAL